MSRRTLGRHILDAAKESKLRIKKHVKDQQYVCLTADIWSTRHRSFLGVTVHWIDKESLERHGAALCCRRFEGSLVFDKIAEKLDEIVTEYEIPVEKIVSTVTDNGRNFVKAFAEFGVKNVPIDIQMQVEAEEENVGNNIECNEDLFDKDDEVNFIRIPENISEVSNQSSYNYCNIILSNHIRCACHTLSLVAITDAQTAIKCKKFATLLHGTMGKCSALWNKGGCPKSSEIIQQIIGCSLKIPCVTRWNSLYDSISILLKSKAKLNDLMISLELPQFKRQEIQFLEEYKTVLAPIACALDRLQGDTIFYGAFIPTLLKINIQLEEIHINSLNYCSALLTAISNGFKSRFSEYLNLSPVVSDAILASVSHPYFKLRWIKAAFGTEEANEDRIQSKKACIKNNFIAAARGFSRNNEIEPELTTSDNEDYYNLESSSRSTSARTPEMMVLAYINDPDQSIMSLVNHPLILGMFLRYNTTLPSSAPVERLFSFAGLINSPRRERLSDMLFERLLLLKANAHI